MVEIFLYSDKKNDHDLSLMQKLYKKGESAVSYGYSLLKK